MTIQKLAYFKKIGIEAKASLAYFISSMILHGMGIITLPFFSRIMSTEQIGVVTIFNSWNAILGTVATLSLNSGANSIAMVEYSDNRDGYQSSILVLSTLSSVFFGSLLIVFYPLLYSLIKLPILLVYVMIIGFILQPAQAYWLSRQRFEYKYKLSSIITVLSSVLSTIFAVLCVYFAKSSDYENLAEVRIIAMSVISFSFAIVFYILLLIRGKNFFNKKYWAFALRVNLPLIVHTLAKQLFDVSDRIIIAELVGQKEVGIYGVLSSISSLSVIAWAAINASLVPFMFTRLKKYDEEGDSNTLHQIRRVVNLMMVFYAVVCFMLALMAPEAVSILTTKEYFAAVSLVPPMAAGVFFTSLYSIYGNILLYYKKSNYLMVATLASAIVNIVLNYLLIPVFGFVVAAYTTLIAQVLLTAIQFLFYKHLTKSNMLHDKVLWSGSLIVIIICLGTSLIYESLLYRLILTTVLAIAVILNRRRIADYIRVSRDL